MWMLHLLFTNRFSKLDFKAQTTATRYSIIVQSCVVFFCFCEILIGDWNFRDVYISVAIKRAKRLVVDNFESNVLRRSFGTYFPMIIDPGIFPSPQKYFRWFGGKGNSGEFYWTE